MPWIWQMMDARPQPEFGVRVILAWQNQHRAPLSPYLPLSFLIVISFLSQRLWIPFLSFYNIYTDILSWKLKVKSWEPSQSQGLFRLKHDVREIRLWLNWMKYIWNAWAGGRRRRRRKWVNRKIELESWTVIIC